MIHIICITSIIIGITYYTHTKCFTVCATASYKYVTRFSSLSPIYYLFAYILSFVYVLIIDL